jgi:hypothetical protein
MSEFEQIAETIGYDEFSATIEDGKFIITPADAGIALFGYIQIAEEQMNQYQEAAEGLRTEFAELREDNSLLRDLLERCYGVLMDAGHVALADEVIEAAYPVRGVVEFIDEVDA